MGQIILGNLYVFFVMSLHITIKEVTWLHIVVYVIIGITQYKSSEFEITTKWFSIKSSKKK